MSFDLSLSTVRDRLRIQVGDTTGDAATELLPDDTYDAVYAYNGNKEPQTLVALAQALIAKFSQQASSINLGDMSFSWRDRMTAWQGIIDKFKGISTSSGGGGFNILRPQRGHEHSEYRRPGEQDPWFNG